MIGDHLGKWVIFKELGRGGMGRVYLANEELNGRQAAVKILSSELAQEAGFLLRFKREIETLSQLSHPNIVQFYEAGFENGLYFYAMEFVNGQGLDDLLKSEGRMPWKEVLDIALQICPALKHVHDHGVIHRDLKPANILRTADGIVKLTDFGIAKVFAQGNLTATGGIVGTAEFLSPEQAAGKPVTKRSDLYSLGAVFYMLLTGHPPFEGASFIDLLHKHRYAQFDPPRKIVPELPYEIDEVVCQLLEKDPAKRPPDCLVLARQFESIRNKLERKGHATRAGLTNAGTVAEHKLSDIISEPGPGPATLMSHLMREELDRLNRESPIARLFNRWYVVLPAFLLVLWFLVWTFWPSGEEALFEQGAALMHSDNRADWERAWNEFLEPLEQRFPAHHHKAAVEQFRKQLEDARQQAAGPAPPNEGKRLFLIGERLRQEGNFNEARQQWKRLVDVFKEVDSEKEWVTKAEAGIAEAKKAAADPKRWAPVRAALKNAEELRNQGNWDNAELIWRGIEALYSNDPDAAPILQEVAKARQK